MLQQFEDRKDELSFLQEVYSLNAFTPVVIYGRRRVGKTALIKHFLMEKNGCYLLLTNDGMEENLKALKECFAKLTDKSYFLSLDTDIYGLFTNFVREAGHERFVIVLDEFPYLMDVQKGVLSVFQKLFDEVLVDSNIMLILSGSSLSMMENDLLGYRSPLYGRNLRIWKLQPFPFREIYRIFGDMDTALDAYFIFGNIPYYLTFYDSSLSLEENIERNVLTKGAPLYEEPLILLRQEFRESRTYRLILKYISQGYRSTGKICSATGMDKGNISRYLSTLVETGIVEHIVPYGRVRGGVYEISDPFTDFWFRFVYPYRSELEIGMKDAVLNRFRRDKDSFFGHRFEQLVRELLLRGDVHGLGPFSEVRRWWHRGTEIDLVAMREDTAFFVECKWQDNVDGEQIKRELESKAQRVNWEGKREYMVFARSFSRKTEFCYDKEDIMRMD